MRTVIIWVLIFVITYAETVIATRAGRADRQSTHALTNHFSKVAAHWSALFQLVLVIDMIVVVSEGWRVAIPIIVGEWLGSYMELERRRKAEAKASPYASSAAASLGAPHIRAEEAS